MSNETRSLGERLRNARLQRGLSQAELATQIGVSKVTLWKWERGEIHPRPKWARQLAELLGLQLEEKGVIKGHTTDILPEGGTIQTRIVREFPSADLGSCIREAKERIAALAGTTPENVTINIAIAC